MLALQLPRTSLCDKSRKNEVEVDEGDGSIFMIIQPCSELYRIFLNNGCKSGLRLEKSNKLTLVRVLSNEESFKD